MSKINENYDRGNFKGTELSFRIFLKCRCQSRVKGLCTPLLHAIASGELLT